MGDEARIARGRGIEIERVAALHLSGKVQIFRRREVLEEIVALERSGGTEAGNAVRRPPGDVAPLEPYAPAIGGKLAADLVDEACLAGAVGTDDDVPLAVLDREAHVVGDDEVAERALKML